MRTFSSEILLIFSGLFLFAVAVVRFNQPPTNRSGTTFLLFYTGLVFYYALLIALWILVILALIGGASTFSWLAKAVKHAIEVDQQLQGWVPIVAALIIVVASRFKHVRGLDTTARSFCMGLAAIPAEADQLGMDLARASFRVSSPKLIEDISREITDNIGSAAVNFSDDGKASSRFTRAVALYWLFIRPNDTGTPLPFPANAGNRSAYARIMYLNEKQIELCVKSYEALIENGVDYFSATTHTRQMDTALNRRIQDLSRMICCLIARYVLFQNVTAIQRRRRLASMGFEVQDQLPAFGLNQWIATILTIIVLFSLLSIVVPGRQPFSNAVLISVLVAVQLGIASVGGTLVAQRFIRGQEGGAKRFPPLAELFAAVLVVGTICIAIRIGWFVVPRLIKTGELDLMRSVTIFQQRWAFLLMPLVCTLSIGVLCGYLGTSPWDWRRLAALGGLVNGLIFAVTGFFIGQLLPEELIPQGSDGDLARTILTSVIGVVGAVLGSIVVAIFRRSIRSSQEATKAGVTVNMLNNKLSFEASPDFQKLNTAVTSGNSNASIDLGGYLRETVQELEGQYLCFRPVLNNSDVTNVYIIVIAWNEKKSCLTFEEKNRFDSKYTQRGVVYVPDGKPFISLLTVDKGAVRLIMVSRPDENLARGLVMTLSHPAGTQFIPTASPVVLRRLGETVPQLGFVHRDSADYPEYVKELKAVMPDFGRFADILDHPGRVTLRPVRPARAAADQGARLTGRSFPAGRHGIDPDVPSLG